MVTKKKTSKKKTKRKVAGRAAPKKRLPGWILLLLGMLFGLVVAVIGYVNGWVPKPENPNSKPVAQVIETQKENTIEDNSEDLAIEPQDNFDFYTTLQDMEVEIDAEDLAQTDTRKPSTYYIQLGAFKRIEDAETLKAKVAFSGISAFIESNKIKGTIWHRVRIGPYTSSRKVDVAKRNLQKSGFNAMIIRQSQ